MNVIITWICANTFTWTAVLAVILGVLKTPKHGLNRPANTLRYLFFIYVGVAFTWSGLMHLFLPTFTAHSIGWATSPFQYEVGLANLSIAILGFMASFKFHRYFWLATILEIIFFAVGAGIGHIYQLKTMHDHATSNAGPLLYTDLFVPILMLIIWFFAKRDEAK